MGGRGLVVGHENPFETCTKMIRKSDFSTLGHEKPGARAGAGQQMHPQALGMAPGSARRSL
jgi:hypothetical protein